MALFHQSEIVHGGIRPANMFINEKNELILGRIKKSDLESMRKTRHLLSRFCIERYMKMYFIYWAPEIINDDPIGKGSDIWALGVILYLLITGKYPFDIKNQEQTLSNIENINVNYRLVLAYPRITYLLKHIFLKNPDERWSAIKVLNYCQEDFAIIIQRFWRGCKERIKFRNKCAALIKVQSNIKGWLVRNRFVQRKFELRWQAASLIQRRFRKHSTSKFYKRTRKLIMRLQANVLTRQNRRAFLKLKRDAIVAQS